MPNQNPRPLDPALNDDLLADIERTAVELAQLAGAEIMAALGGMLSVKYKGGSDKEQSWKDPVSEVDHRVEVLIRARLSERFPEHEIIGEELDERAGRDSDLIWAIDPIDGTTNFVNGFPMFAATVGVLHKGVPVVGAIWCTTSHAVRAGVYHARAGAPLFFDGAPVARKTNPDVRRSLAGVTKASGLIGAWDTRKTGSAAIECALVAAGALDVARFDNVNLWDVAGGVALVWAARGMVNVLEEQRWKTLERFEATDLRLWHSPMILGCEDAVTAMTEIAEAA